MTLQLGSSGEIVKKLQKFLKIKSDGIFGPKTEYAVKKWQKENDLNSDGIVDDYILSMMGLSVVPDIGFETTDISNLIESYIEIDESHLLPEGEYIRSNLKKHWVFLHHTAGWHDPFKTILAWKNDNRGIIATEFVIGGQSIDGNDNQYDGKIVRAFPSGSYAWHLGIGNNELHRKSLGIELCSFGQLTKGGYFKNGKWISMEKNHFYTYTGRKVHDSQIITLPQKFRGYEHWHKYSEEQLHSLKKLLYYIAEKENINIKKGLPELIHSHGIYQAFDFCNIKYVKEHPGLWTHANVLKTKKDVFPQQELVDLILSL